MNSDLDLFGAPLPVALPIADGVKKKRKTPKAKGYAARPGSGPAGETCQTCEHSCRVGGHARHYWKCGLCRRSWTHGPGSDIKARSPACQMWEAEKSNQASHASEL